MWILLVLIYGIFKGIRDIAKKKALTISGVVEVLFVYTLLAFLLTVPTAGKVTGVAAATMAAIAFKSFIIFIAFLCSFYAIEKMPISLYGVLDLSRMLFAMILGVIVLHEPLGIIQIISMLLVAGGLLLLKYKPKAIRKQTVSDEKPVPGYIFLFAFISTFLNAVSGIMDKMLMSKGNLTSGQLQFWYMLFMVVYYGIYVLIKKTKINWKSVLKNPYVYLIAILFVVADRCLFVANGYPQAKVTVMTLLKQVCCVVTIIGGRLIFKEKNTLQRFIAAAVIITGIVLAAI